MAAGSDTLNDRTILSLVRDASVEARENLAWLRAQMHPILFVTSREEPEKIATLCLGCGASHRTGICSSPTSPTS